MNNFSLYHFRKPLKMQIHIRGQNNHVLEVQPTETIGEIKHKLSILEGIDAEDFTLSCEGSTLQVEDSVSTLSSVELDFNIPLLGGKVHGSLARAGKVKGQTPKVEKQEKKKKKTGRAKRRIQFNRRFANVVQSFGRRRGPNANSS
uniref:CSON005696 protein n=1 Tax=Culicoides sonorensis TaxID=179676 RepID=A0A336MQZ1_CULSO